MPMIWTAPAVALTHRGAVVYHTYKNESADDRNEFWYNTDYAESEVYAFDVRDLPVPAGVDPSNHALIIAHAIDNGLVAFEDEIELDEIQVGAVVEGMANPGDSVAVDVAAWLLAASQEELYELAMGVGVKARALITSHSGCRTRIILSLSFWLDLPMALMPFEWSLMPIRP